MEVLVCTLDPAGNQYLQNIIIKYSKIEASKIETPRVLAEDLNRFHIPGKTQTFAMADTVFLLAERNIQRDVQLELQPFRVNKSAVSRTGTYLGAQLQSAHHFGRSSVTVEGV